MDVTNSHLLIEKYFSQLTDLQQSQFKNLFPIYKEWNEKINVISRKDMDSFYLHHVLHSLALTKMTNWKSDQQILDVGTGGGFPGIPLAIIFPEVKFTLIDSIGKKIKVVNEVKHALELKNVVAIHDRMENLHGVFFDAIVSRAVAPANTLYQWTKHLMKKPFAENGGWFFLKGGNLKEELFDLNMKHTLKPINDFFQEDYFGEKVVLHFR